jgi:hypothetical protein
MKVSLKGLVFSKQNLEAIKNAYASKIVKIDGNQDKKVVGDLIAAALK